MSNSQKSYSGIDYFRIVAALLIVAIHVFSINFVGDFLFARVIARVAVPFFFMTSGFFIVSRYSFDNRRLVSFVKKILLIYVITIIVYLPVNYYRGDFSTHNTLSVIIKDLMFNGTMYHLWYLPASIMGIIIAWYLVKKLSYGKAFFITLMLYLVGMFGDSYYGISEKFSTLKAFYNQIFSISDYTRNGIFFAPIFFVLGGYISDKFKRISLVSAIKGLIISFALMLCEALILWKNDLQRHDSMYLFLIPCMYFLFNILLHFRGKRHKNLWRLSLLVYIIHPFVIVVVHMVDRKLRLDGLITDNNIIHYVAISGLSILGSIVLIKIYDVFFPSAIKHDTKTDRAYLEIDLKNLTHNVIVLQKAMPDNCELMAVAKAEAYGHGMYEVSTYLNKIGVNAFAVATIDEGIKLRQYGVTGLILILGYTNPLRAKELNKYKLTQALIGYEQAKLFAEQKYDVMVHIKIDTGMHRLGFASNNVDEIAAVFSMEHIKVEGIFSHLCAADSLEEDDVIFTNKQIENFNNVVSTLKNKGFKIPKVHIQSSYGLFNYPELDCDYVRAGVALYGVLSSPNDKVKLNLDLKPVLSLKSRVASVKLIKAGETVGYNRAFCAQRDSVIAILPIGYADGYPRNLSFVDSYVLIRGQKAPIAGKVCMDQMAIDVTDIPDIKVGEVATLIGCDNNAEISAPEVADLSGSITNELLSRMGQRLKIVCKK